MPRAKGIQPSAPFHAYDQSLGAEIPRVIGELGDPAPVVVEGPVNLSTEEFNEEVLTVVMHESTEKDALDLVPIWINGRVQNFARGHPQQVKRKYVEKLARTKRTTFSQNRTPGLGEAGNTMYPKMALEFPFSVMHDPNPNGAAWLRKVLAEPV